MAILTYLLSFFGSSVTREIKDVYETWKSAETNEAKLEAEKQLAWLTAQKEVIISEQSRWLTAWIRPALALPVVVYVWKIVVWDTVLQWGVTPNPGEFVNYIVLTILGAYFLTRPFEKR